MILHKNIHHNRLLPSTTEVTSPSSKQTLWLTLSHFPNVICCPIYTLFKILPKLFVDILVLYYSIHTKTMLCIYVYHWTVKKTNNQYLLNTKEIKQGWNNGTAGQVLALHKAPRFNPGIPYGPPRPLGIILP